jgi:hypothetical protein
MKPAISQLQDAASALLKVKESLVLSFTYSEREGTFVLVCTFPEKAPGSSRAFARCSFSGVHDFVREPGDLEMLGPFNSTFNARTLSSPQVIESIKFKRERSGEMIDLWFGYNFGGVRFKYKYLYVDKRDTKSVKRDGDTVYFDLFTGDELDFYDIFGDLKH